jgi:hypothetical protein
MVYIGKISYSLYLWHWPLLAFAEYEFGHDLQAWHRALLLVAAVSISVATYHFIEQPARRAGPPVTRNFVFAAGAAALLLTAALSQFIVKGRGLPGRLDPQIAELARATPTRVPRTGLCGFNADGQVTRTSSRDCFIGDQSAAKASFLLWGDSHAAALGQTIVKVATVEGVKGFNVGRGGCPALIGLEKYSAFWPRCSQLTRQALAALDDPNVTHVILAGRWGYYAEGVPLQHEPAARPRRFVENLDANREEFAKLLVQTVEKITAAGKQAIVIGPTPEFPVNIPATLIRNAMKGVKEDIVMPRSEFDARQLGSLRALARLERLQGVQVIYPHQLFCDQLHCRATANGRALYVDDDHLSPTGAALLETALQPGFGAMGSSKH